MKIGYNLDSKENDAHNLDGEKMDKETRQMFREKVQSLQKRLKNMIQLLSKLKQ